MQIIFNVPNTIGYVRLCILLSSLYFLQSHFYIFIFLHLVDFILDFLDGFIARRYNQITLFGSWLDVILDNFRRTILWAQLFPFGFLISSLEWITFVCNHTKGIKWKYINKESPWIVLLISKNDYQTIWGIHALWSLDLLPIWLLYVFKISFYSSYVIVFISCLLISGRISCAIVEIWCIYEHIILLCSIQDNTTF